MENTPLLSTTPFFRTEEDVEYLNEVDGPSTWDLFREECVILVKYSLPVFVFVQITTSRV
jgi:MATE family multidrug resistance protein